LLRHERHQNLKTTEKRTSSEVKDERSGERKPPDRMDNPTRQ